MKKIKRIFLSLITLILSFCMINTVLADSTGSITINGTTAEKTYEIYKIFDLTYNGTKVAYTIDEDFVNFFNGDGEDYIVTSNTDAEGNSIGLNPITIGNATKYINITEDNKVAFSESILTYIAKNNLNSDRSEKATGDTIEFTDLELGYYLVYPKGATDIKKGESTICTLTSTMPSVTVNVKATYPEIKKKANDESVDVGELVKFTITGQVPTTTGYSKYIYKISDTWTGGLKLPSNIELDFNVTFGETKIEATPTITETGFTLEFDMTKYQDYKGQIITITYNLKITEKAITETTKNSATLEYSNNPKNGDETEITPPQEVELYSSQIRIEKTDSETNPLSNAHFVLSKVNKEGETVYYQAIDNSGNVITSTNETVIYTTKGVTKVNWVIDKTTATLLVTNDEGIAEFIGIENGTYYLEEEKAPEGYNKLTGPVEITIEPSEDATTQSVTQITDVINYSGTELPSTGGIGTKLFIIIGSLLIIVSTTVLVATKKISE